MDQAPASAIPTRGRGGSRVRSALALALTVALVLIAQVASAGPRPPALGPDRAAQVPEPRGGGPQLGVELVADGLVAPVSLTFSPDGTGRRFIVDQTGLVLVLTPDGRVLPTPFLDIRDRVVLSNAFDERGLLELAFHPDFARNGRLYVQYSAQREGPNICVAADGTVPAEPGGCPLQYTRRVSEFAVSTAGSNRVDPATERVVFSLQWPSRKHNGGGLAFGPDGLLYIGLGDGGFVHGPGGGIDPFEVPPALRFGDLLAQDLSSLYGKILRIDVDSGRPYGIPPDNPFVGPDGIPDEIWAWGFRNPFRMSFDSGGDRALFVSATGETLFEVTYKVTGPGNYGWASKEGTSCFDRATPYAPPRSCPQTGPLGEPLRDPVIQYFNAAVDDPLSQVDGDGFGRASLGGHMYRGRQIPWLRGRFVQGDFARDDLDGQLLVASPMPAASGKLWRLHRAYRFDPTNPALSGFMKSVGRDAEGELYAITGNFTPTGLEGRIWKIVDR